MTDPAPILDDELIVTVRIHVCAADVRDRMAREVLKLLPTIAAGLQPLMDPYGEDAYLAGIDVSVPDFQPIGAAASGSTMLTYQPPAPGVVP